MGSMDLEMHREKYVNLIESELLIKYVDFLAVFACALES